MECQVREFSVIGGSTVEDATRRIMRTVFTTNLALQYNWTGHASKKSAVRVELTKHDDHYAYICLSANWYNLSRLQSLAEAVMQGSLHLNVTVG